MTALVKFENHFEGKETLVFVHNGDHIVINGCQTFSTSNMESVFEGYDVPESMQNDVRQAIKTLDQEVSDDDLKLILSIYPTYLKLIANQTPDLCMVAVQNDGNALQFVKEQTPEICMIAVNKKGCALEHVKEQTPEICIEAVKNDPWAIQFVKEQTPELCMLAVQNDGIAIRYIKEQTEELCMIAVQNYGRAIEYVKDKSMVAQIA